MQHERADADQQSAASARKARLSPQARRWRRLGWTIAAVAICSIALWIVIFWLAGALANVAAGA